MTERQFLDTAYGLDDMDKTRSFYDDWAATYDAEIARNGYATPRRCAEALAEHADPGAAVLDLGCGTGLSGVALRAAGFTTIDGAEPSAEMRARAEASGAYRAVLAIEPEDPLPFPAGAYANVVAAGVISPGHAPPEAMDKALAILPVGGCLVFSLNDHALEEAAYPGRAAALVADGVADLIHHQHGPHLPGIGLESTIYVLQKR